MAAGLRVVLDTNVLLSARRSSHPASPNVEILSRWQRSEFVFCYSLDTLTEYTEKLLEHGIPEAEVEAFIRLLARLGEAVPIVFFHFQHYPVDADDVMFLLCAINGEASHLVSYDEHLLTLRHFYAPDLVICESLEFLTACRTAIQAGS